MIDIEIVTISYELHYLYFSHDEDKILKLKKKFENTKSAERWHEEETSMFRKYVWWKKQRIQRQPQEWEKLLEV